MSTAQIAIIKMKTEAPIDGSYQYSNLRPAFPKKIQSLDFVRNSLKEGRNIYSSELENQIPHTKISLHGFRYP